MDANAMSLKLSSPAATSNQRREIMQSRKVTGETGLSLIETMLALLIFSVGILAAASMQTTSMQSTTRAKSTAYGSRAALAILEKIQALPYTDGLLTDKDGGYDLQNPDFGPIQIDDSSAMLEWEIQDGFPAPGLKRITVTARWQGPGAKTGTIRYNLVRSKDYH